MLLSTDRCTCKFEWNLEILILNPEKALQALNLRHYKMYQDIQRVLSQNVLLTPLRRYFILPPALCLHTPLWIVHQSVPPKLTILCPSAHAAILKQIDPEAVKSSHIFCVPTSRYFEKAASSWATACLRDRWNGGSDFLFIYLQDGDSYLSVASVQTIGAILHKPITLIPPSESSISHLQLFCFPNYKF
jgi:hypothetical protein